MSQKTNDCVLLIFFVLLFTACTKELPFPDVKDAPLMVVNSLFSPDEELLVHVSESCHIKSRDCTGSNITEAEVYLLSPQGERLVDLEHQGQGIFQNTNFQIQPDTEYRLEVKSTDGKLADVSSKRKVPSVPTAKVVNVEEGTIAGELLWIFHLEINDNATEENYYLLEGTFDIIGGRHDDGESEINGYIEPHFGHYSDDPNSENKEIASGLDFTTYPLRSVYLTDKNFNGENYKTSIGIRDWDLPSNGVIADIYIKSVSKEMYDYHKTLDLHRINGEDIFSEPQQIFSNIEQGLGIFAGFSQKHISMELPPSEYVLPTDINIVNDGCVGPCSVSFSTDGGDKLNYSWEFGDGGKSSEPAPEHTYTKAGEYEVLVTISDGRGSSGFWNFVIVIN